MSISTVLFDLDGTLIDSIELILKSYHHTMAAHGLPPVSDAEWLAGLGTPLWVQFRPFAEEPGRLEGLIATYREYNLAHHDAMVTAYPGVVEAVVAIRGAGLRTGVVTSKNRSGAVRGLRRVGLEDQVDVIVGADEIANPKPHPEPIRIALARLGEHPERAMYVGDSVHDMESGRAAGVATGAVLWGPFRREHLEETRPSHWLERPADLLRVLGINGGRVR
ncbi:MAG TPA: HAD-IA family hydrolase [Gemmatimonadales bacterium]|nr:HAD-IA family hydrolase [Gemmatimonadales bacterium]